MQAETQLGLRDAVARRYQRLRALPDEQLGLEPETATRTLYRQLLNSANEEADCDPATDAISVGIVEKERYHRRQCRWLLFVRRECCRRLHPRESPSGPADDLRSAAVDPIALLTWRKAIVLSCGTSEEVSRRVDGAWDPLGA
jgi:hypothetical protein